MAAFNCRRSLSIVLLLAFSCLFCIDLVSAGAPFVQRIIASSASAYGKLVCIASKTGAPGQASLRYCDASNPSHVYDWVGASIKSDANLCLDAGVGVAGGPVLLNACDFIPTQQWTYDDFGRWVSAFDPNLCVEIAADSVGDFSKQGHKLVLATCSFSKTQAYIYLTGWPNTPAGQFTGDISSLVPDGGGNKLCLDSMGSKEGAAVNSQAKLCTGSSAQTATTVAVNVVTTGNLVKMYKPVFTGAPGFPSATFQIRFPNPPGDNSGLPLCLAASCNSRNCDFFGNPDVQVIVRKCTTQQGTTLPHDTFLYNNKGNILSQYFTRFNNTICLGVANNKVVLRDCSFKTFANKWRF